MSQIKCPRCGEVFQVDESGWAQIVQQVRNDEFAREIEQRLELLRTEHGHEVELAVERERGTMREEASAKDARIAELEAQVRAALERAELLEKNARADAAGEKERLEAELREAQSAAKLRESDVRGELQGQIADRDRRIAELEASLASRDEAAKVGRELAVKQAQIDADAARSAVERERDELRARLESQEREAQTARELAVQQERTIAAEQRAAIERQRDELAAEVGRLRVEAQGLEAAHKIELAEKLRAKDEQIASREQEIERIRDMRARLSTKMLGETLEQHCEVAFNQIRMTAFPSAYFEKDTEAVRSDDDDRPTKGDYVFRECDEAGNEIVSIMFEMKNEQEDGIGHKRNEDHFKKLDADRTKKGCEYAVLVSLLEPESELYNAGIVDVSYRYPKMYVVRPQFFIPIITLLRNAALKSMEYKAELELARRQSVDVTRFEERLDEFKTKFGRNYAAASKKFQKAIDEIDETIKHLTRVRESLVGSEHSLSVANRTAEDLTIRKLTYKNPTMRQMFKDARQSAGELGEGAPGEDGAAFEAEHADSDVVQAEEE